MARMNGEQKLITLPLVWVHQQRGVLIAIDTLVKDAIRQGLPLDPHKVQSFLPPNATKAFENNLAHLDGLEAWDCSCGWSWLSDEACTACGERFRFRRNR